MKQSLCGMLMCILILFSSCSKDQESGTVTLTFMGWEASPLETASVQRGIEAFEALNPGIKVSYTPIPQSGYLPRLLASLSGKNPPDVFFCQTADYRSLAQRGVLFDITEQFSADFPLDDFIDSSRTIMDIDGRVYGISSCSVSPVIYYNKDIFDRYGIPYPSPNPGEAWTIDEFRAVAKSLTRDGIYGCYGLETNGGMINTLVISGGGRQFSDDYLHCVYNSPQTKAVLETIKAIRTVDGSAPASSTLENAGMNAAQMLQTGKVAMLMDGSWAYQQLLSLGFPVGIAPLPSFGQPLTTGQAHLHSIAAASKHKEEAWKLLTFLSGMDYQGRLCSEGLWLPNRKSLWAAGSGGMDGWYGESVLGPYYLQMRDYLMNAAVDPQAMQRLPILGDIIAEEHDRFFKDGKDIDQALADIERRVNAELATLQ